MGKLPVETVGAGTVIVMLRLLVALALVESVARTVNVELPAVLGAPEIAPPALIDRPPGKLPESIAHAYGGTPPEALTVTE